MPQILKREIKEKILKSALDSFLESGYRNASMQSVAQRAGIAAGNIYHYFKNKEEVFSTLIGPALEEIKAIFNVRMIDLPTLLPLDGAGFAERKMDEFIGIYQKNQKVFVLLFEKSGSTEFETTKADVIESLYATVIRAKNALTPAPATRRQETLVRAYVTAYVNGIISILTEKTDDTVKLDALRLFLPFMRSKLIENL